ncbi:NtaA/DmoA family FMN-dependent monooxygenase [Streptomyces sp. NPDC059255]|uniref:NtaA/DmoA family FMN-dependent monooxygenase n=1 Tax=Streptomyces sp. NPDC059255 TaxID=3346793 RepID=UPI0036BBD8E0
MTVTPERLRFTHFTSFAPAGPPGPMWDHPKARDFDYLNIDHWVKLAQALEAAKFDGFFWADHSSVHDVYQSSYTTAVREAMQFPLGDPLSLTAALATSTKDLGFAFSANIIQDHPYAFARRLSTLDHITRGRIGWNVVTSFQPSAWRNLGHDQVGGHSARYEQAEEYLTVLYKLLEGSWEDDAVVRDLEERIYADPAKVHPIQHQGKYYNVPGIHTNEPSAQRVPFLFQAGTSKDGRAFAARNAEALFIFAHNPNAARSVITDVRSRFQELGRRTEDVLFFVHHNIVVGSTEEEAKRKSAEADEYLSSEALLAFSSSTMGTDLSQIDLDSPVGNFETNALQGQFRALAEAAPDKSWTFREVVMAMTTNRIVGTPEQIADELEQWRDAGVRGINVGSITGPDDTYAFLEHAVPVLQERGLMQSEYGPGTFREKMFDGTTGPRLNDRHPAARQRRPHNGS